MIGQTLAHYRVTAALGAGGMGEVYRATDTRLGREVALKVLPAAFASDAERLARFEREARVLASLNHSSIAHLYGFESATLQDGTSVTLIAMELVAGEDLAQRLARGPIPLDEAIQIAKQMAEALEEAHEKGFVHRDLKPANVKVTPDGKVKVLDFGLAKAWAGSASGGSASPDLSRSPTLAQTGTAAGIILGTAAYMSPEQARGRDVDKRSDIWAFGVVLFEMLTGKRLFRGETTSDILAAILTRDPDLSALPPGTPEPVRRLLSRCFERDPKRRLRDIGDARWELEQPLDSSRREPSRPRVAMTWAIAAAALLAGLAIGLLRRGSGPTAAPRETMHLDLAYPRGVEPLGARDAGFALSPDGTTVAMVGVKDGVRRLFVHRLERAETEEVPDTAGGNGVTFSTDSQSVAVVSVTGVVTRHSLRDRQRKVIATGVDWTSGLASSESGVVFVRSGALFLAPEDGGPARPLTTLDSGRNEVAHEEPVVLHGRRTVLFSSLTRDSGTERIEAVSLDGGPRSVVVERATTPVVSSTGHLLFARDGVVLAASFDEASARVSGAAVPVLPAGAVGSRLSGGLGLQLSRSGTLLYMPSEFNSKRVVSVSRDGSAVPVGLPGGRYGSPRVSPDGRRLLIEVSGSTLETLEMPDGKRSTLTAAALGTSFPTWSSDGRRVVFRRFGAPTWVAADGSGKEGAIPETLANDSPSGPGPDPDSVLAIRGQSETSGDVYLVSISGAWKPRPLLATKAYEGGPRISPDGRFLLYASNESGRLEIYVRPFPALDQAWQISDGGGAQAVWSRSGREITYRSGGRLVAVSVDASTDPPRFGKPTPLFADDEYAFGMGLTIPNYDVTPDGRFILLRHDPRSDTLRVVVSWTEELKRIVAAGGIR